MCGQTTPEFRLPSVVRKISGPFRHGRRVAGLLNTLEIAGQVAASAIGPEPASVRRRPAVEFDTSRGLVRAVDGVELERLPWRDDGDCRRIGLREIRRPWS